MELMANPQITDFQQNVNGDITMLKLGTKKEDAWENIAEQGASAKLENNKAATIDVSTYTEPVEVTPSSGKDGMKKATITLSNIPAGGGDFKSAYLFRASNSNVAVFFETEGYPTPDTTVNIAVAIPNDTEWGMSSTGKLTYFYVGPATFTIGDGGCGELCYWLHPTESTPGGVLHDMSSAYKWTE